MRTKTRMKTEWGLETKGAQTTNEVRRLCPRLETRMRLESQVCIFHFLILFILTNIYRSESLAYGHHTGNGTTTPPTNAKSRTRMRTGTGTGRAHGQGQGQGRVWYFIINSTLFSRY